MNNMLSGLGFLWRGFGLLKRPKLLPYVIGPILINIAILFFGISALVDFFSAWLNAYLESIPSWLSFLEWVLKPLFYLSLILFVVFTFTLFANLIGSPFYGLMAEQVESELNSSVNSPPLNVKTLLAAIPHALVREAQKIIYYTLRLIPIAIVWLLSLFIPILTPLVSIIFFLFGAWIIAIQYVDYAYDNNCIGIKKLVTDLKQHRSASLAFGSITAFATMIPVFNILVIPAAVCGGTIFYI